MPIQPANTLTQVPIEWLWPGYLAVGSLAILDGDPGQGKSLITIDLAARLTMGRGWPDGVPMAGAASVLFMCDEDVDSVILARLKAAGADLSRVFLWPRLDDPGLPRIPTDIARIGEALAHTGAKLLVIDPIVAFLDSTVQVSGDANVRRALRPLAGLAVEHRCVILLIRHLNKRTENQSLYRGGGSIAFVAACRLAWLAGRDPKMEERCVLAQAKNNYAPKKPSLAYTLPKDGPRVDWQGPCLWCADELAARRARPSRRRARDFLRAFLEAGPRLSHEVWAAAAAERLSKKTVHRAKDELGIRYERISRRGERLDYWLMPGQEVPAGLSDTPEADELLRKLGEQWAGREVVDEEACEDASCERDENELEQAFPRSGVGPSFKTRSC